MSHKQFVDSFHRVVASYTGGSVNVVRCHFFDNQPQDIFVTTPMFLLNNVYAMDYPVQGNGNIIRCYPGACSEFNIGMLGYGCRRLTNRLGNNCSLCRPGLYLPAETTYSSCLACLPGQHAPRSGMSSCESCSAADIKMETENYVLNVSSRKVWQRLPCLYQCPARVIPYRLPRCGWARVCRHQTVPRRILLQRYRFASRPMPAGPYHGSKRIGKLFQMPRGQGWNRWHVPSLSREFCDAQTGNTHCFLV